MPWLKYTLRMLKAQNNQDFELICVDSGSTDGSWELLQAHQPDVLYQIAPQDYIPGKVLNDAIKHARGEYIVFNNADCIPLDRDWLDQLVQPLINDPTVVAVFANQIARKDAIPLVKKDYERAFGDGKISANWRHFFSLASSAVRSDIIREYPFNPDIQYSEDIEWSWRMKALGHQIRYVPEARVEHSHNYTLAQIKKRYMGEGKAERFIYRDYYKEHPEDLDFFRSVVLAASMEYIRDIFYLIRTKRLDWLVKAKLYRFAQRYYAYKGRTAPSVMSKRARLMVSCLAFDNGKSGISDYTVNVVRELLKHEALTLLIHPEDKAVFPLEDPGLSFEIVPQWLARPIFSMIWHLYALPRLIAKRKWQMVFLPAGNRRLLAHYKVPTAVTFHDLSQFHIPGKYDALRMAYIKKVIPHYLNKAPAVFAISESTKNDMIRYYKMKPEQITLNYNGYNPAKLDTDMPLSELQEKYGLKGKYMLYIARIEHPGKNHLNLLKAYELLPEEIKAEYELVCGGGKWNNSEIVLDYHANMKDRERVHFPGFVSGDDIAALYHNAALYVFPSLYEGFGIPLLEAFASGIPVICSDRSSLPEIGAEAVRLFDPDDAQSIADAMQTVLNDPTLQLQMIFLGSERFKDFSWEKHADMILENLRGQLKE